MIIKRRWLYLLIIVCLIIGVIFPNEGSPIQHFWRELSVPRIQSEMDLLVNRVTLENMDRLLQTRISRSVSRGNRYSENCIEGATELIYLTSRSLQEVASDYADVFNTVFEESLSRGEAWYSITIGDKSSLLILPVARAETSLPSFATPYPNICSQSNACYIISISYADPSESVCDM